MAKDKGGLTGEPGPRFTQFRNNGEGTVTYNGPHGPVHVHPGNTLRLPDGQAELVVPGLTPVAEEDAESRIQAGLQAQRDTRWQRPDDGHVPYAGSDDRPRRDELEDQPFSVRIPGVTEACPDKGTCHHNCGDGACFRVLHAGPLSGRYEGDVWPQEIRARHGQLMHDAAIPPFTLDASGLPAATDALRQETRQDGKPIAPAIPPPGAIVRKPWDFTISPEGKIRYKLRSGDVLWVSVDQSSGMLMVESEKSPIMVTPDSPSRIRVM